jgi:hypothetical protein
MLNKIKELCNKYKNPLIIIFVIIITSLAIFLDRKLIPEK